MIASGLYLTVVKTLMNSWPLLHYKATLKSVLYLIHKHSLHKVKNLLSYRQVQIHTLIDDDLKIIFQVMRKLSGHL